MDEEGGFTLLSSSALRAVPLIECHEQAIWEGEQSNDNEEATTPGCMYGSNAEGRSFSQEPTKYAAQ